MRSLSPWDTLMMEAAPALLSSLLTSVPSLVVDVALIALAVSRWGRHPRVSMLAATAGVVLLVLDVVGRAFFALLPAWASQQGRPVSELGAIYAAVGLVSSALHAVAMGVLVAAVFTERGTAPGATHTRNG